MSYRKPYPPEVRERAVRMVFEQQRPSTGVNGVEEAVVLRVAWGSEAGAYAFHRQPESIGGATGKRFESPLGVPVGAFVECVDRDHADREMLVCFDFLADRIPVGVVDGDERP